MNFSDTRPRIPIRCQDKNESLKNDSPIDNNALKCVTKEKTFDLQPVSPYSFGEGLPYAPEGWPNPGDVWGWKVAGRRNLAGYFTDRALIPPASLQNGPRKLEFRSKAVIRRYLQSNFPNMTIEAFLALFSWLVPSAEQTPTKALQLLETGEDATDDSGTQRKSRRKTKSDSHSTGEEDATDDSGRHKAKSDSPPTNKSFALVPFSPLLTPDQVANFEAYLDKLEDMIDMYLETTPLDHGTSATVLDIESIECCKKKLSSLLALDFPALVSSNDVAEVATLASKIREDPNLSVDQLFKLKLVEQVPLASEAFLEAKGSLEQANKFMADLQAKKLILPSLKKEYNELKEKVAQREAEMDICALSIKEIDDQIRQLQSKRNRISNVLETMQKGKVELTSELTNVANSISTLAQEIQSELSQKSKWNLKKANNVRRVAEIQEKFLTLKGLTF